MSTHNPFAFDVADGGASGAPVDQDGTGALTKIQADSRPPTSLVQQAAEQNRDVVTRNVEALLLDNFRQPTKGTPPYQELHQFFVDDLKRNSKAPSPQGKPCDEPSTNYVQQAAEQNKDTVIRNVEALLSENFRHFPEEPPTNYIEQAIEQKSKPTAGNLEQRILIDNVGLALARGNVMADQASGLLPPIYLGVVGAEGLKDFWHSGNEDVKVSKFVFQNFKAFGQDPATIVKGLAGLEQQINQNLLDAHTGKPLVGEDRDLMRQMAENAAMIKLAIAEFRQTSDHKAAEALVSGSGHSVNDLIRIAGEHGANRKNMRQLQKMADEIAPPR